MYREIFGLQVRKLEFLLAAAIEDGASHVITGGAMQSNHCRTTAVACASIGLQAHVFHSSDAKVRNFVLRFSIVCVISLVCLGLTVRASSQVHFIIL